jgi:antitoxin ParD1/3/4
MGDAVTVTLGGMGKRAREWIEQGDYASMSEVVRDGLRALEREREALNAYYRAKVEEALADPRPYLTLDEAFEKINATPFPKK